MSSIKVSNQLGGKAKFCSTPNIVDKGDSKGIRGFAHCGSSILVFPSSLVTRAKR